LHALAVDIPSFNPHIFACVFYMLIPPELIFSNAF
jgi:hypothetical protein